MEGVCKGGEEWGYGTMSWAGLWTHHISLSSPLWASATSPSSAATSALCSPGAVANENLKIIATAADADDDKSKAAHEINEMFLALLAQSCCRYDYCYYWCHCPPPATSYPHHLWTVATTMHATQLCATKKEAISRHQHNNNGNTNNFCCLSQHFGHTFSLFIVVVVAFEIYDFLAIGNRLRVASSLFWDRKLLNFNSKIMHNVPF